MAPRVGMGRTQEMGWDSTLTYTPRLIFDASTHQVVIAQHSGRQTAGVPRKCQPGGGCLWCDGSFSIGMVKVRPASSAKILVPRTQATLLHDISAEVRAGVHAVALAADGWRCASEEAVDE